MKKLKVIKIDADKCTACGACEMACSAFHAEPKYSIVNPARSRIRVNYDKFRDVYAPIRATGYTKAECRGRNTYTINGKEYDECSFCGASCPSRDFFKEPDSGLPLRCDMCEGEDEPQCVKWCASDALTYEEREEEEKAEESVEQEEMELAYEILVKKHGKKNVIDTFARLSKGKNIRVKKEN